MATHMAQSSSSSRPMPPVVFHQHDRKSLPDLRLKSKDTKMGPKIIQISPTMSFLSTRFIGHEVVKTKKGYDVIIDLEGTSENSGEYAVSFHTPGAVEEFVKELYNSLDLEVVSVKRIC